MKEKLKASEKELKKQREEYDSLLGEETMNLTDRSTMDSEVAKKTEEVAELKGQINHLNNSNRHISQKLKDATDNILKDYREKEENEREILTLKRN